jgi:hypothetical protein
MVPAGRKILVLSKSQLRYDFEKEEDTSRKISNFYPMGIAGIGVTGRCALKI